LLWFPGGPRLVFSSSLLQEVIGADRAHHTPAVTRAGRTAGVWKAHTHIRTSLLLTRVAAPLGTWNLRSKEQGAFRLSAFGGGSQEAGAVSKKRRYAKGQGGQGNRGMHRKRTSPRLLARCPLLGSWMQRTAYCRFSRSLPPTARPAASGGPPGIQAGRRTVRYCTAAQANGQLARRQFTSF
jgi:hypothetical protein